MCNGRTSKGTQCSRKAEWCFQHLDQKPAEEPVAEPVVEPVVEEPVVEEPIAEEPIAEEPIAEEPIAEEPIAKKNDTQELIETEEEIVSEDIVPTMSPNATATQPESVIVEESKSKPVENNSNVKVLNAEVFDCPPYAKDAHTVCTDADRYGMAFKILISQGHMLRIYKKLHDVDIADMGVRVKILFYNCSEDALESGDDIKYRRLFVVAENLLTYEAAVAKVTDMINNIRTSELILRLKDYDEYLYDLCKLISPNWFRDRDNMWGFTRMVYQMQGDSGLYRRTYAAILANQFGERFNEQMAMTSYDLEGPETKYRNKITIGSLKAVAGGSNPDGYREWKAKHEPVSVEKEATKTDKDKDSKKKLSVLLKEQLIIAAKDVYRREFGTGIIYKKKTDYYYTRAFRDPKEFLNEIFGADEKYHMCSQTDPKELLHFIKDIAHPDFPFMKIDYDYMGFKNGVYYLKTAKFLEGDAIPKNIQARVYFDNDWVLLEETPLLDKYFSYQFDEESVVEFIYFMLGRALTKIKDKFDFMIMLVGIGGCGKSLLLNLISYAFGAGKVGTLGASFQDKFGLSEFANKQIVVSDDMPRNIAKTLPKSDFLSMQSRGRISCPVKGKASIEVESWDIPTIINSNDLPNYSDTSGEIVRRVIIPHFTNAVPDAEKDTQLEDKIKSLEFCSFIHKCRSTYLEYCKTYAGKNVYNFCPQHFIDSRDMLRGSINESYQFGKAHLRYVEPAKDKVPSKILKSDLTNIYQGEIQSWKVA